MQVLVLIMDAACNSLNCLPANNRVAYDVMEDARWLRNCRAYLYEELAERFAKEDLSNIVMYLTQLNERNGAILCRISTISYKHNFPLSVCVMSSHIFESSDKLCLSIHKSIPNAFRRENCKSKHNYLYQH